MRKLEYLETKRGLVARPAACIDDCLREAAMLSIEQQQDVTFAFNQYTYRIVFRDVWRCYERELTEPAGNKDLDQTPAEKPLPRSVKASDLQSGDVFVPMPISPLHIVIESRSVHKEEDDSVVSKCIDYQGVNCADGIEGTIIVDYSSVGGDPELLLLEREKGTVT